MHESTGLPNQRHAGLSKAPEDWSTVRGPKGGLIPWVSSAACLDDLAMHGKVQHGPPTTAGTAPPGFSRQAEHASIPGTESPEAPTSADIGGYSPQTQAEPECSASHAGSSSSTAAPVLGLQELSRGRYLAIARSRAPHKMEL